MTERVAVIGGGLMGHGIAQVFAMAQHPVTVFDADARVLETVRERVRANLAQMDADERVADAIELCDALDAAVADADLVVEAVSESLELKRALFKRISETVAADAILASNTSVISIGEIAQQARDPGRVVGTHFWNPPYLVPLVEVTQGLTTRLETVQRTMALLAQAGKQPVHVKRDVPGFVGNRLQHALWREAIALVAEGVCSADEVDTVVKQSFGLRLPVLGPLENADLIGLDLTLAIHEYVLPHIDSTPAPSPLLRELVERGELGMKTGRGLREWTDREADEVRSRLFEHLVVATKGKR